MKLASIIMSSAVIAAVFVACGGTRDRGPNHNDVNATETTTDPATTPMTTEPNVPADTNTATGVGAGGTQAGQPTTSWTEGPGSPGGTRTNTGDPPHTQHTSTVTGGIIGSSAKQQPVTVNAGTGTGLPTSTGASIPTTGTGPR